MSFKSKRFSAVIIFTSVELAFVFLGMIYNAANGHEIDFGGLAACFGALVIQGGGYVAAETIRPSGFYKDLKSEKEVEL